MRIDWNRCAEPQADQHDTQVILHLVTNTVTPLRRQRHVRRPVGSSPSIFDGAVAVRYVAEQCPGHPRNQHGHLQHPHIDEAVRLVARWPALYQQFKAIMDTFHPMVDATIPVEEWPNRIGSNSHADEDKFGTMYGTIFDPIGLAEAMSHELAHTKLRGLGLYVEKAYRFITNPEDQLLESPIRKDRMRPMTAVFHAQYSFIHVTQMDLEMLRVENDPAAASTMLRLLSNNVPRMELGDGEIRKHVQLDLAGEAFFDGFYRWSDRILSEANQVLERHGVPKMALQRTPAEPPDAAPADHESDAADLRSASLADYID